MLKERAFDQDALSFEINFYKVQETFRKSASKVLAFWLRIAVSR